MVSPEEVRDQKSSGENGRKGEWEKIRQSRILLPKAKSQEPKFN